MSKDLVAVFSTRGVTKKAADKIAEALDADLFEIEPEIPYTIEDLDWHNEETRSTKEMKDPNARPAYKGKVENMDQYDTIFVGFPIWWFKAPRIINTFLEDYDLTGKTIVPFATSGNTLMDQVNEDLIPSVKGGRLVEGHRVLSGINADQIEEWKKSIQSA